MTRLLILRPQPGASETQERARALGLDPIVAPLFVIEPRDWAVPDPAQFDALLLTSANAVRAAGDGLDQLRALPVHAVGAATARAARDAGFAIASIGQSGADALLATLPPMLRLLHVCGEHRHMSSDRPGTAAIAVYRSAERPGTEWRAELADIVALLHSPRAARVFAKRVDERGADRAAIAIAAISPAAAVAAGSGWRSVGIASEPTDEALLALAARLCETESRGVRE